MKCPVCHTLINQGICPNCGYKDNNSAYTIVKEEPIEIKEPKITLSFTQTARHYKAIAYSIGIGILLFCGIMAAFNNAVSNNEGSYGIYPLDNITADQLKDDGAKHFAYKHINQIIALANKYNFEYTQQADLYCLKQGNFVEYYGYLEKDDVTYTIEMSNNKNSITHLSFFVTGSYEGKESSLSYLNEDIMNEIGQIFGYQSVYQHFSNYYPLLKKDEENPGYKHTTKTIDNLEIFIKENIGEDFNQTLYEYRITVIQ